MFNDGGGWSTGMQGRSFGDKWIVVKCLGIAESGGEDRDRAEEIDDGTLYMGCKEDDSVTGGKKVINPGL
jgi:hypothetical protein